MATFRKRGNVWQVQIRRNGFKPLSKSFQRRKDAEVWAREKERRLDRGDFSIFDSDDRTLGDLLARYLAAITPTKRSAHQESYRIGKLTRHPIALTKAVKLTASQIAAFRDERLQGVSNDTVRQDLILIRQVLDVAGREWDLKLDSNPVDKVRKPSPGKPRMRRVEYSDLRAIAVALRSSRNPLFRELLLFALATGMRRGEILKIEWIDIDWRQRVLIIPETKNGDPRIIPLSSRALRILEKVKQHEVVNDRVFPMSENSVRLAWQRLRKRANLGDLRLHDFRHEAVSRFFEAGLSLPEVALISGHRDPKMLLRYTHLEAAKLALKLN